jgi:diguanylate cyclase (GGDEF)-like protein/PAS domain S-box-containing protein
MKFLEQSIKNYFSLKTEKRRSDESKRGNGEIPSSDESNLTSQQLGTSLNELNCLMKDPILNSNKINSVINKEALILVTDINGVIIYLNDKYSASLGYASEELISKHTKIFKTGVHSEKFYRNLWKTLLSGGVWKGEMTAKGKDNSIKWYFMSVFPLLDDNGKPYQFLTIKTDITDLKKVEQQPLIMEKQVPSFFEILTNIVAGCMDQNGKIIYLSPSVEDIFGYKVSDRVGFSVFDNIDFKTLPNFRRLLDDLKKVPSSSNSMEVRVKSKSGSLRSCEFSAKNCLDDPIQRGIFFTCRDTTEQDLYDQEIKKMRLYDSLTGLPNQRYFEEHLNKEIDYAKEMNMNLAIVQLGLDGFRFVNSALGHPTGNQLLKDLSTRMNNAFNENVIIHKMGGDIFTILIKNIIEYDDIHKILNELISLINKEPFKIDEDEVHITVSMGVSVYPYSGEEIDILLKNAEIAMYHAKNRGKNQYQIFSSTMNLYSYKQFSLRNDSKQALLRNEFDIYYQPRINPITNEIASAEALIRWNHPKWGMVLPDEFISMAEESGLIIPIGEWVIREVCYKLKKWEEENLSIKKISINLSALQLLQSNFVDMVSSILNEFSVDPKWIEFEITETVMIEKEVQIFTTFAAMRKLGITIALDDFGAGYSSLNYLRKLPCEIIKIDKSLIRDIHRDKDNFEIVSSIITLCHKLKKSVVAEGVENEEQLSLLRKLHCNEIQGYIYSKPVAENEYKRFLKEGIGTKVEKAASIPKINRREYFRVQLKIPLLADMTIKEFENKIVNIGSIEVFIENIGPGGLCFSSPLKLPVSNDIILLFITEIFSVEWQLKGKIVWQKEMGDNYFLYGMKFILDDVDQMELIKVLNSLQVRLRQKTILPDCRFFTK